MANLTKKSHFTHRRQYDVFLSFRGEDIRDTFISHLYGALCNAGFYTFIDYNLEGGKKISDELRKKIELSKLSIVVLSENYASSTWCLDELDHIFKCYKKNGQIVLPVFYKVEPSEVRKQEKKFGKHLAEHEKTFKDDVKVKNWRVVLKEVGGLAGCDYKGGLEYEFIQKIIEKIRKLGIKGDILFVAIYPVGVDSRAKDVESLIDIKSNDVHIVGIHGLGGIGKTTIAKSVYNRIFDSFEESYFLENVRENSRKDDGLIKLQEKILSKILQEQHWKIISVSEGTNEIKRRLCSKRVLLILDDVDNLKQIEDILGNCDWLLPGSRIIITTRDKHLLSTLDMTKTYEVKKLENHEALELFSQHAFHKVEPDEEYSELTNQALYYAQSLPLALKVVGSNLFGQKKPQWEDTLRQYEKYFNGDIYHILKVSFDGLGENEKNIFLDISCFFKGRSKGFVVNILEKCKLYPIAGIPILVNKSLITINQNDTLSMHDLIQQMGMEIARLESPYIFRKRSRLCCYEDALEVLIGNKGSEEIRGIMLHPPTPVQVRLHPKAFKNMENLQFLIVHNVQISEELTDLPSGLRFLEWPKYPFNFPSNYCPQQLVALEMPKSCITLEKFSIQGFQFENVKSINLHGCKSITVLPGLCTPNLETLDLGECEDLIRVEEANGCLYKLRVWTLVSCKNLEILPSKLNLKCLKYFNVACCGKLEKFPHIEPEMKCLEELYMNYSGIREWPSSLEYLTNGLTALHLQNGQNLKNFLDGTNALRLYGFMSLKRLDLRYFDFDRNMVDLNVWLKPDFFPVLEALYLSESNIVTIPESITKFTRLEYLDLSDCKQLQEIPRLPQSIRILDAKNCYSLDPQSSSRLFDQCGEFLGILHDSKSECKYGDHDRQIIIPGDKTPMWFESNLHQSYGNSISFSVGPKIPKFGIFIAFQSTKALLEEADCFVNVYINGFPVEEAKNEEVADHIVKVEEMSKNLWFICVSPGLYCKSDPSGKNDVKVECVVFLDDENEFSCDDSTDFIKWMGVHVECICCPTYLGSSSMTQISDSTCGSSLVLYDTEQLLPLPLVSSVLGSNNGGHSRHAKIRLQQKSLAESEEAHPQEQKMSTRQSKYARLRSLRDDPISSIAPEAKKRKIGSDKTPPASPALFPFSSSSTPFMEPTEGTPTTAIIPSATRAKGKVKAETSVWESASLAMGRAHNVVSEEELKELTSVPSHELVGRHIHKLVQVLGESLRLTTDYLTTEVALVKANSKTDEVEVECAKLRGDLVNSMDRLFVANEKIAELEKALQAERRLVLEKDDQIKGALLYTEESKNRVIEEFKAGEAFANIMDLQGFKGFELLRRWMVKHQGEAVDFSSLDLEQVETEILANEAKKKESEIAGEVAAVIVDLEVEATSLDVEKSVFVEGFDRTTEGAEVPGGTESVDRPSDHP